MSYWPDSYSSAISLTFDDGLASHLDLAIPEMDRRGIRGTFYLNPKGDKDENSPNSWQSNLNKWINASQTRHEMGNHSLNHPCSLNIKVDWSPKNLQDMTLEDIHDDLLEAQHRLMSIFHDQLYTSFAYPCYESTVGRGLNRVSYTPIVANMFIAARARGEKANDPLYCDLHHLSSFPVERMPGAYLIGLVEQSVISGHWCIFTFHGINEGHLPISLVDFIELVDHLDRRRDAVWIAPVAEIALHIKNMNGLEKNLV